MNRQLFKSFLIVTIGLINFGYSTKAQNISTIAGNGVAGGSGDGTAATGAQLNAPRGICVDHSGNVYIADFANHKVRKVDGSTGIISTIAGTGVSGYTGNGGAATNAKLANPADVCVDTNGNVYIAEYSNHCIRKINSSTGFISTIAGTGTAGYSGDGGLAINAKLNVPRGVFTDKSGNVYIAEEGNHTIRKVTFSTGIITTIVGTNSAGYSGDGGIATNAKLNTPEGVATDDSGNVYIADRYNNRIRKVSGSSGIISTIAGTGTAGFSGDGSLAINANLNIPFGVELDIFGNIYIADRGNERIRKINVSTGVITSVAGNGTAGYSGDGSPAINAMLNGPIGICLDTSGNIYIGDTNNNRIRKVTNSPTAIAERIISDNVIHAYPNPSNGEFTLSTEASDEICIYNSSGKKIFFSKAISNITTINISDQPSGVYLINILSSKSSVNKKVILNH